MERMGPGLNLQAGFLRRGMMCVSLLDMTHEKMPWGPGQRRQQRHISSAVTGTAKQTPASAAFFLRNESGRTKTHVNVHYGH